MINSADLTCGGHVPIGFGVGAGDCRRQLFSMPSRFAFDVSTRSVAHRDAIGERAAPAHLRVNDRRAGVAFSSLRSRLLRVATPVPTQAIGRGIAKGIGL